MFKKIFALIAAVFTVSIFSSNDALAQNGYKIRAGDTLRVEVVEDANLNRSVLVLPDGSISFPFADGVRAAGRTTGQVAAALASSMSSNFAATPNVYVSVGEIGRSTGGSSAPKAPKTQDIYITGEINSPGKLEGRRGMTVLQAIAQGGGLTRFAAPKRIQVRRGSKIYSYNYNTNAGNIRLKAGDVIIVPQRKLFE
ncbi:polysaccharide biosynthesis/export family protein [Aliiroseovarius sp. 2305UL8-7]|uniref:polysaccharide biosynthesis/export family protein n=1 Tax=Aliiroseovarius conchicola TaxID=3121637 RepID=UPI003528A9EF